MLSAGEKAPEFTLLNENAENVALTNFAGKKVLVYFYPKASTPGCTVQANGLNDVLDTLTEHNVVVLGISIDAPKRLINFKTKQGLNFTLLSDEDHAVCEAFGVWQLKKFMGKEYMGIVRTSFLINESGVVEKVFDKFKTKDHHEVVLQYLKSA
ncbi:MAG: thioredoxin-dependent thiol peroxidase [Glaciecola sp.]